MQTEIAGLQIETKLAGVFRGPSRVSGTDLQHHRSRGLVAGHKIRFLADGKWLTKSKKYSSDVIFDPNRELFSSE